eukprot:m.310319 g.310319  ORF g.310319 m.310319 type:complete len:270 (+) comp50883_c0_seq1:88-897(+)
MDEVGDEIKPEAEACATAAAVAADGPEKELEKENDSEGGSFEEVSLKVVYRKTTFQVTRSLGSTVGELKAHLQDLTGVPSGMMKLMYKGSLNDDARLLKDVNLFNGAKMMVVGSTANDLLKAVPVKPEQGKHAETSRIGVGKEPLSTQKPHSKIISKGIPADAMKGNKRRQERLPAASLSGMVNKDGNKVRLTFKLELDQIWLETKERTQKVNMPSIYSIVSEPISGHEDYHMMAFQFGPTEQSRYWIYWIPAQYMKALKDTVLGAFPL